jgi:uncharacterized surface protein with fasciclin (FAS1) repeats
MKNYFVKTFYRFDKLLIILAAGILLFSSCADDYPYDDKEPDWLGSSIYDYLESDGNYTNYVRLIDDLGYKEVLSLTGSKTLFVAKDSAFVEFYKNNPWGVTSYEQLTIPQKKYLLYFSMINNPYIIERLSNYSLGNVFYEGAAMRRSTALSPIDSITHDINETVPDSKYWNHYKTNGIYILKDNTEIPTAYFIQSFLNKYAITNEDFTMLTGVSRQKDDVHIFGNKIIQRDITCKNGYIQIMQSVMLPPTNMAQYIASNPSTKIFSKLLDRFSAPYYDHKNTIAYKTLHPEFTDSIFVKNYFASNGGTRYLPNPKVVSGVSITPAVNLLTFDPGWNSYTSNNASIKSDMAAMFVPTDEAMTNYFNSGVGEILKGRFGSWENIPDEIILPFMKRHMRNSLVESVPSKFNKMVDAENYRLPVEKSHIEGTYTGVNGEVFLTNEVYPPVDYISVYSPVLLSNNAKIMNWAINISETSVDGTKFAFYKLYLNSLVSTYGLFIPTDEFFDKYIDPIAYGQNIQGVLKFWFNDLTSTVNATVYKYDKNLDVVGDSVAVITAADFLKNRIWSILDAHIVVGDVKDGNQYFVTKGNDIIKVTGTGTSMQVQGGNDITRNTSASVSKVFNQYNGTTYFLDKPIDPAIKSVYNILGNTPQFEEFFTLLNGVPESSLQQIFAIQGVDSRIKFFNAYRYTVYVPTNEAIQAAIANNTIKDWATINAMTDGTSKTVEIDKMLRFLKYHFQDNAVFFGQPVNEQYQSATIKIDNTTTHWGTYKNKYYKIGVVGSANSLTLTLDTKSGEPVRTAHVVTTDGLYNLIAKDYIFAKKLTDYKFVDGTGPAAGSLFSTSSVTTSASAVIHQIDNVLNFE